MTNENAQSRDNRTDGNGGDLHVDLWVRRPVCGPRTTVIDRLSSLRSTDDIDEFSVTTWPEEIVLTGPNRQEGLLETIGGFEDWAADRGLGLRPPFETRTASRLVGDSEDVLRTPMLLAVAREDEDIAGIYPCTDGTTTWTVPEFLDALETDRDGLHPGLGEQSVLPTTGRTTS